MVVTILPPLSTQITAKLYAFTPSEFVWHDLQCIDGSFTFEEWGVASGRADVIVAPNIGDYAVCTDSSDNWYFYAVITSIEYDHKRHVYSIKLKDPVSAALDGEVEFSAGTAAEVLAEIATASGTIFNPAYRTPVTEIFGTYEDPIQWVDLVKSISLAEGAYVAFSPRGEIVVNADGGFQAEHGDETIVPVTPLQATTTIDRNRYGNFAVVTVDADWTESASTPITTTDTGYGITRTITKIGEQPQSVDTDLGDGYGVEESWTWDVDGNLTRYDRSEASELEQTDGYTTYTLGAGGSLVVYEETIVQKRYNPMGSWYNYRKYMKTTTTNVDEGAPIQIDEYTSWYFPEEPAWHNKYWVRTLALAAMPGVIASYKVTSYEWSEITETFFLQKTETVEGELKKPEVTKILAVNKIGKHFSSTATDAASISALGEREQEYDAFGLSTITDVERAAAKFLAYCQRAHTATVDVPLQPFCIGDYVSWKGERWTVEQVTVDMRSWRTGLKLTRRASIADMSVSMLADAQDIGMAVAGLVEKKAKRLHNAARGQIIAQIDYETYQVHLQSDPAGKTRIARVDYQRGITYRPGKEVLLVRPTGKNARWEIVTRRNEESTVISSVTGEEDWYTPITTSVVLGRDVFEPSDTMILYVQNLNRAKAIQVSWGDEGSEVVRNYTRGVTYGNRITDWEPAAANPLYENWYYDNLEQRYAEYLVREILAPLDPEANPTQACSGKIRIQGAFGEWSDWETFSYEFRTPGPKKLEYTLGTPYYGDTAADCDSAPVVDAAFLLNVDFSPWLAGRWNIEYGHMVDGAFVSLSTWGSAARTHFRRLNGTIAVPLTGRFVWRFSEDGEDWHSTPTSNDLFVQVGNGTTWGDSYEVPHGTSTSFGTFGEIGLCPGDGTERLYDWFALEKDETGDATITIPCRLGYSGPGEHYSGSTSAAYNYGPPFPGIATEYHPFVYTDFSYSWDERGEVVS